MSDFDPDELMKIVGQNTAKPIDKILARQDHQLGYLHAISTALDRVPDRDTKSMLATITGTMRGIHTVLWVIAVLLVTIAAKAWSS